MNFENKKILITGASGGIGKSLIRKFHDLGGDILATGTKTEKLQALKNEFKKIKIKPFKLDGHSEIEKFIEESFKELNGLDILVNNAGITLDNISLRLTEEN